MKSREIVLEGRGHFRIVVLVFLGLLPLILAHSIDPLTHLGNLNPEFEELTHGHKCIHDQLEDYRRHKMGSIPIVHQANMPVYEVTTTIEEQKRLLREREQLVEDVIADDRKRHLLQATRPPHQPIRIHVAAESLNNDPYTCYSPGQQIVVADGGLTASYTCRAEDVMTPAKRDYLVNTLMRVSVEWLEKALSVVRTSNGITQLGISGCTSTPLAVPVAGSYTNPGIDADFVIFITARPILGGSTLAFASTCAVNHLGRPIAGHANFNASNLVDNPMDLPRQSGIAVHEICHALGFSSSRWNSGTFIQYTGTGSGDNWPYTRLDPSVVVTTVHANGYSFGRLITPRVVSTLRSYFNCPTIEGGDLEDSGGQGTAGSHWEKRLFMNEFMTGTENAFPVKSEITLALFYDSGWYDINVTHAEKLLWGRGRGCGFYQGDCGGWMNLPNPMPGLCNKVDTTKVTCTFDRRAYGVCNMAQLSGIPPHFQHYGSPTLGGQMAIADHCAFIQGTTWCNTGGKSPQFADVLDFGVSANGESFTLTSRCMMSTLNRIDAPFQVESLSVITPPAVKSARCYNVTCVAPDDLRIQVDKVWWRCLKGDQPIPGFGGVVTCPDAAEICAGQPYDHTWPQMGTITPNHGPPGTRITITGANFLPEYEPYEVQVEFLATNVTRISNTEIQATLAGPEKYVSITDLAIFQTQKHVVIRDNRGYTANKEKGFIIEVEFDGQYLTHLFNWMKKNPGWALLIWAILLCPFVTCGCILWRVLRKKKKPKRGDFHENVNPDEYYEDDYEVDDYYNEQYGGDDGLSPRSDDRGPVVGVYDDYDADPYGPPVAVAPTPSRSPQSHAAPARGHSQPRPPSQHYQAPPAQATAPVYAPPPSMGGAFDAPPPQPQPQPLQPVFIPPPQHSQSQQRQSHPPAAPSDSERHAAPPPSDGLSASSSSREGLGTDDDSGSHSAELSSGWEVADDEEEVLPRMTQPQSDGLSDQEEGPSDSSYEKADD